jgi:ABC-2 type transport system ATP-binding protein
VENLLRRRGQMGKTIIVSSHILPELADVCNKIGIINRGVMEVNATVADVMKLVREQTILQVEVTGDQAAAAEVLRGHHLVDDVQLGDNRLLVTLIAGDDDYSELSTVLVGAGHGIRMFREEEINLETAFMKLTKGAGVKI